MNVNEEKFYNDCFTEVEEGKINAEFNNATVSCISSKNNKFSMDSEGNLVVNSIITREKNNIETNFDAIYPIGSFYFTSSNTNPSTLFGGTWEQIKDTFILGCGDKYQNGSIGGEETHLLTQQESGLREHTHELPLSTSVGVGSYSDIPSRAINGNTDSSFRTGRITAINDMTRDYGAVFVEGTPSANAIVPHNNMPPYLAVYIWKRIS